MMEFPTTYDTFTIPTGATTGARIVINEDNTGTIRVYNQNDILVAEISGKDESTGAFEAFQATGDFATALQGNGLEYYYAPSGLYIPLADFQALSNRYVGWNTLLEGGVAFDVQTRSLAVIHRGTTSTVETWNAPTPGTGWDLGSGIGGSYPPLKWRYMSEDDIWVFGVFHATSATPSQPLFTGFPNVNITGPLGGVGVGGAASRINAASTTFSWYVNDTGQLRSAGLPAIAANDTYMINARIPLGDVS